MQLARKCCPDSRMADNTAREINIYNTKEINMHRKKATPHEGAFSDADRQGTAYGSRIGMPIGAERTMQLGGTGLAQDERRIVGIDARTGHDADAPRSLAHEAAQQGNALEGRGSLARREQAVTAQTDDVIERLLGATAHIKGPMEGDGERTLLPYPAGRTDKATAEGKVDVALGRECPDDHAMGSQKTGAADGVEHSLGLKVTIHKISSPRTYEHMRADACRYGMPHQCIGRSEPVEGQLSTQLNALGSALDSSIHRRQTVTTDL